VVIVAIAAFRATADILVYLATLAYLVIVAPEFLDTAELPDIVAILE
jgi:hypothetical protein